MNQTELKIMVCPFCGSDHVYVNQLEPQRRFWIECNKCETTDPKMHDLPKDAIDSWNSAFCWQASQKEQKRFLLSEQSNAKLAKIIEKTLPFVEQMAHHGKCQNRSNLKCMSCEATEVLKEVLPPLEWAEFQASIKL